MPSRKNPIITGEIYHVFNRSVAGQPVFTSTRDLNRTLEMMKYYIFKKPPTRFSHFERFKSEEKEKVMVELRKSGKRLVELYAFCFMPNHFHLLIKELEAGGITEFIRNFQNSYAKFFNIKYKRSGSLFQIQFKAVLIETDEQLIHVCRYIHLNPLTAFLVKEFNDLAGYKWCSYREYVNKTDSKLVSTGVILSYFKDKQEFVNFHQDQVGYQRQLGRIKHLLLE